MKLQEIIWRRRVKLTLFLHTLQELGEPGGSVVECWTPEREVGGSKPTAAVLCPWARHFTPRKYWLITQEAVAPSWHDWKIVDWDVKPQHKQTYRNFPVADQCKEMSSSMGGVRQHSCMRSDLSSSANGLDVNIFDGSPTKRILTANWGILM